MSDPARRLALIIIGGITVALAPAAWAHLPVLVAQPAFATKGQPVTLGYAFGHPYEGVFQAAARPRRVRVFPPQGAPLDLTGDLEGQGPEDARAWRVRFVPEQRGDHLAVIEAAPAVHGDEVLEDVTRVNVNVSGVQVGWDRALGLGVELVPLTRPYGIPAGTTLRAKLLVDGEPAPGVHVEVERKSPSPPDPAALPPDAFITRVEKTGAAGELCVVLPEDGWWVLAASVSGGAVQVDGAERTRVRRGSLWVFVGREAGR